VRLFITGGSELKSAKGTTHGDPSAMAIYAISLQPAGVPITQMVLDLWKR